MAAAIMCGISLWLGEKTEHDATRRARRAAHEHGLSRRGPDGVAYAEVEVGAGCVMEVAGSLLQLRGSEACSPIRQDERGNVLAYNGTSRERMQYVISMIY